MPARTEVPPAAAVVLLAKLLGTMLLALLLLVAFLKWGTTDAGRFVTGMLGIDTGSPVFPYARSAVRGFQQIGLIATLALPLQLVFPAVRRSPKVLTYEFVLDLIYSFQGLWLTLVSFDVAILWVRSVLYGDRAPFVPSLATLPFALQVVLVIWALDLVVYWRHRLEHTFSGLWAFHAVHHTTERVDFLTTTRLHPLELALGSIVNAAVTQVGFDPAANGLAITFYLYYNNFIHTNVRFRFDGPMKYVLVTPFMHQWHHAKDEVAFGRNLGVVFAWNDWLFGTAHHPAHFPTEFGLAVPEPERVRHSYVRHLLYPLQYLWARTRAARPLPA